MIFLDLVISIAPRPQMALISQIGTAKISVLKDEIAFFAYLASLREKKVVKKRTQTPSAHLYLPNDTWK